MGVHVSATEIFFMAQKKLLRVLFQSQRYAHTNPLFKEFKLLKLSDIIYFQSNLFVYKALHIYPVDSGFQYISHDPDSRRPNNLRLPLCRTTHVQQNIAVRGAKCWNNLPENIKCITNCNVFKQKIKEKLLNSYYHSYSLFLCIVYL